MQNYKIPRREILRLYESSLKEISTHSIGQWLKIVTDDKFVIVSKSQIEIHNKCISNIAAEISKILNNIDIMEEYLSITERIP